MVIFSTIPISPNLMTCLQNTMTNKQFPEDTHAKHFEREMGCLIVVMLDELTRLYT